MTEAARVYAELQAAGAGLEYLDVGGGLGVDYDGSQTNFESSVNYTLQEYATDVVHHVQSGLRRGRRAAPDDHHRKRPGRGGLSQLPGLRRAGRRRPGQRRRKPARRSRPMSSSRCTTWSIPIKNVTARNVLESYHDAQQAMDVAMTLCSAPAICRSSSGRMAENLFWAICRKIKRLAEQLEFVPEELEGLDTLLSDTYFCNFSLFQSMPDSWAIKQLFPVMPIHRLRRAADAARRARRHHLRQRRQDRPVHRPPRREADAAAAPVRRPAVLPGRVPDRRLSGNPGRPAQPVRRHQHRPRRPRRQRRGRARSDVVKGDTVREVLDYVEFEPSDLITPARRPPSKPPSAKAASAYQEAGRFLKFYEEGLHGYTYLEEPDER